MEKDKIFEDAQRMCTKLEENFVSLGGLLSVIKSGKLYRFKGYETFKSFVETEYHMTGAKAGKLVKVYDVFIGNMDMPEDDLKRLGYDKVSLIEPIVRDANHKDREEWVGKADMLDIPELRDEIKAFKESSKTVDIKAIYTEQTLQKIQEWTNTKNKKNLMFAISLYFQDINMEDVVKKISVQMRKFEDAIQGGEVDIQ